jgi:hypothetical protein
MVTKRSVLFLQRTEGLASMLEREGGVLQPLTRSASVRRFPRKETQPIVHLAVLRSLFLKYLPRQCYLLLRSELNM